MKAMILAAGRGERMRPLTDELPKPLLEVGGKALIVWHIERLRAAGIRDIVINHAWLGRMIERTLGDGVALDVQITYSAETAALETAGGIARALPLLGEAPFLVVNGDVYCEWDFRRASSATVRLARSAFAAWLVMVPNPPHHPRGDFRIASGIISDQSAPATGGAFTFSGIGVYRPALFGDIRQGEKAALAPLLRRAMVEARVAGELFDGAWTDVGTPARLHELDCALRVAHSARTGIK